ncbi:MAG: hypothetical protein RI909_1558 [Bacteroidota bacterium]|jgi:hypothetical protein
MSRYLLLLFLLISYASLAQKATIKRIELNGEKIIVYYDLEDDNPNNEYQINLFVSKDNFSTPVSKVKGDVGSEIKPGSDKRVEWNIFEEFSSYKGDLELEIRGKVFIPFVKLQSFGHGRSYKRGKAYELAWRPGNTNPVHVEVFKGSQRVQGELNIPNNGKYTLNLNPHLKPGKKYNLKITDSRKSDDFVTTEKFKVKRKMPLFFKLIPVFGAAYLVYTQVGASKEDDLPGVPELPANTN